MILETIGILVALGIAASFMERKKPITAKAMRPRDDGIQPLKTRDEYLTALRDNIRMLNQANSMWVKLSRADHALKAAEVLHHLDPQIPLFAEQLEHLRDVRRAIYNELLRHQVGKALADIRSATDLRYQRRLADGLVEQLAAEHTKGFADPKLIEHYRHTVQQFRKELDWGKDLQERCEHGLLNESVRAVLDACQSSLDLFLESDVPDSVQFFNGAELKIGQYGSLVSS